MYIYRTAFVAKKRKKMETQNAKFKTLIDTAVNGIKNQNNANRKYAKKVSKPERARFKGSFKFKSKEGRRTMFSLDWVKDHTGGTTRWVDNERDGLMWLKLQVLKSIQRNDFVELKIFVTLSAEKRTDVMNYDTEILYFTNRMNMYELEKQIPFIQFCKQTNRLLITEELLKEAERQMELREEANRIKSLKSY